MELPPQLIEILGGGRPSEPVLDLLPVPREHILPILTLLQASDEAPATSKTKAHAELWRYIHRAMPYTKGKNLTLNTTNCTNPVIQVHGPSDPPAAGRDGVLAAYQIPFEHVYRMYELMDLQRAGPLHRYNLWTYIGEIIPEVAADAHASWSIDTHDEDVWITKNVMNEKKPS